MLRAVNALLASMGFAIAGMVANRPRTKVDVEKRMFENSDGKM